MVDGRAWERERKGLLVRLSLSLDQENELVCFLLDQVGETEAVLRLSGEGGNVCVRDKVCGTGVGGKWSPSALQGARWAACMCDCGSAAAASLAEKPGVCHQQRLHGSIAAENDVGDGHGWMTLYTRLRAKKVRDTL